MVRMAQKNNFKIVGIQVEPTRYSSRSIKLIKKIPNFWNIVYKNYPSVSSDEVLSGMYHLVFKKI